MSKVFPFKNLVALLSKLKLLGGTLIYCAYRGTYHDIACLPC